MESIKPFPKVAERPCIFERIYFSRPDSMLGGNTVYSYRKNLGIELAKEHHVDADTVVPVPDSGFQPLLAMLSSQACHLNLV